MDFPKSVNAPDPAMFTRRLVVHPNGSEGVLEAAGQEETSGILRFEPSSSGLYIVAVQTEPKLIVLNAEDFNHYLVADGLPHIYALRHKEGTLNETARERFSKSPKLLIQAGEGGGDFRQPLGLPLEIVPQGNPFLLSVGQTLLVRVLFQGRPLAGANLGWDHPGDGEAASGTVRTNDEGDALLPIRQTGLMTIRLTHMTRPRTADYEWESFWTTLTFQIPAGQE
jgi:hypothetical protein